MLPPQLSPHVSTEDAEIGNIYDDSDDSDDREFYYRPHVEDVEPSENHLTPETENEQDIATGRDTARDACVPDADTDLDNLSIERQSFGEESELEILTPDVPQAQSGTDSDGDTGERNASNHSDDPIEGIVLTSSEHEDADNDEEEDIIGATVSTSSEDKDIDEDQDDGDEEMIEFVHTDADAGGENERLPRALRDLADFNQRGRQEDPCHEKRHTVRRRIYSDDSSDDQEDTLVSERSNVLLTPGTKVKQSRLTRLKENVKRRRKDRDDGISKLRAIASSPTEDGDEDPSAPAAEVVSENSGDHEEEDPAGTEDLHEQEEVIEDNDVNQPSRVRSTRVRRPPRKLEYDEPGIPSINAMIAVPTVKSQHQRQYYNNVRYRYSQSQSHTYFPSNVQPLNRNVKPFNRNVTPNINGYATNQYYNPNVQSEYNQLHSLSNETPTENVYTINQYYNPSFQNEYCRYPNEYYNRQSEYSQSMWPANLPHSFCCDYTNGYNC